MPLSDVSVNIMDRNAKARYYPKSLSQSLSKPDDAARTDLAANPSSLQGMLKNTTETGEIGLFSIRQSRTLRSTARPTPQELDIGLRQPQTHQFQENGQSRPSSGRQNSMQSCKDGTTASSVVSVYQNESQKPFRFPTHRPREDESRSYSMSQSSRVSYTLSNHRSFGNLRPNPPFAYPTRLKRPGYRPSSPALCDFVGTDVRTHVGLESGTLRTPSPFFPTPHRRSPMSYNQNSTRSTVTTQFQSLPFAISQNRARMTPPVRHQTPIIRPGSGQSIRSTTIEYRRQASHGSTWGLQESAPPSPLYYDYTEAFEQETHYQSTNVSVLSLVEQMIPERQSAEEYYELEDNGPNTECAKMLAQEDAPITSTGASAVIYPSGPIATVEITSTVTVPLLELVGNLEVEKKEETKLDEGVASLKEMERVGIHGDAIERERGKEVVIDPAFNDTMGHHILSSSRPRKKTFPTARGNLETQTHTRNETAQMIYGSENSCSLKDNLPLPQSDEVISDAAGKSIGLFHSRYKRKFSSLVRGPSVNSVRDEDLNGQIVARASSATGFVDNNSPSIYAPVPERPISSQSHRDRYSRIFSIDDSFAELARIVLNSEVKGGLGSAIDPLLEDVSINGMVGSMAPLVSARRSSSSDYSVHRPSEHNPIREHSRYLDISEEARTKNSARGSSPRILKKGLSDEGVPRVDSGILAGLIQPALPHHHEEYGGWPVVVKSGIESLQKKPLVSLVQDSPSSANLKDQILSGDPRSAESKTTSVRPSDAAVIVPWEFDEPEHLGVFPVARYKLERRLPRASSASPPGSRSWDIDAIGPWDNQPVNLSNIFQPPFHGAEESARTYPEIKSKITRASSSTNDLKELAGMKDKPSVSQEQGVAIATECFNKDIRLLKNKEHVQRGIEATLESSPIHTRFIENIEDYTRSLPHISLRAPSAALGQGDVRSFFSDDSSNAGQKRSLRKHFSQLRAIASRTNSVDDFRNSERRLTLSALGRSPITARTIAWNHGRRSAQSAPSTEGMSALRYAKWKMREKFKSWWLRGEERLRVLGERIKREGRK